MYRRRRRTRNRAVRRYLRRRRRYRRRLRRYCNPRKCYRTSKTARRALRIAKQGLGYHTNRLLNTQHLTSGNFKSNFTTIMSHNRNQLVTALDLLRFYDPSTNTMVTKDKGAIANYPGSFRILRSTINVRVFNPGPNPCHVTIMAIRTKADTNDDPPAAWLGGMINQTVGYVPTTTDRWIKPSESRIFRSHFRVARRRDAFLYAGQSFEFSYDPGRYTYTPSVHNQLAQTRTTGVRSYDICIRMRGADALGIDAGGQPDNTEYIPDMTADLQVYKRRTYTIRYEAGSKLEDYSITDNVGEPSGAGYCTPCPPSNVTKSTYDVIAGNDPN